MAILSIQSHVSYGYVGNKAAVFPLQTMGYDVWPIHTVQFSNHTGYGSWQGQIYSSEHISNLVDGLIALDKIHECQAVLSGYLGSAAIGHAIQDSVQRLKQLNPEIIYLCDPVIGDIGRGVFVQPEVLDFYQKNLAADIITPNHFEAEILSGHKITDLSQAKKAAEHFHGLGIATVLITSLQLPQMPADTLYIFLSCSGKAYLLSTPCYPFTLAPNGTGDLFSALFLGSYLRSRDSVQALQDSTHLIDQVMLTTWQHNSRELKLLEVDYRKLPEKSCLTIQKC